MEQQAAGYEWRTGITTYTEDQVLVRGYDLTELVGQVDFSSAVYLVLCGELPGKAQSRMLDALLVSCVDHGVAPSEAVARIVAASGVPLQACVAAGLLTIGDIHGGAGEQLAKVLQEAVQEMKQQGASVEETADRIVTQYKREKKRLPGYGHPLHPQGDPRAPRLLELADQLNVSGPHVALARTLEVSLGRMLGRRLAMSIDGATACILSDIGLHWKCARPLLLISRAAGLSAHAIEEVTRERGWRGIPHDRVLYDGPAPRRLNPDDRG